MVVEKEPKKITFASILKNPLYKNRNAIYLLVPPGGLVHRLQQKNELIMELAPILMNSAVSCVFLYGNPGTGKTSVITELLGELQDEANNHDVSLQSAYVNCSENRTETTILIDVLNQINEEKTYPRLGWTRAKAISEFTMIMDKKKTNVLLILDEVDYALKESGDDILYRLSRINNKVKSNVSTILISNDVRVAEYIKPKTQSALGRVKIIFSPYSAEELNDILKDRSKIAFKDGAVGEAVIKKIAEIEGQRGGDARKALELLDACAKIAVAKGRKKITLDLVDKADTTLEKDTALGTIATLTKQQKLLLLAMLRTNKKELESGSVYRFYVDTCKKQNAEPLSVRRVRTFLVHFDELGILESEVTWLKSLNKKGRKIWLGMDDATKKKARKLIRDTI
ncbi:MAG: Cdc6/Cdc18 family protein [Candidatus Nanoarchaeia archaeon]